MYRFLIKISDKNAVNLANFESKHGKITAKTAIKMGAKRVKILEDKR